MFYQRRLLLKAFGIAAPLIVGAASMLRSATALAAAWNKNAFEAKAPAEALKALGVSGAQASKDIVLTAPDIAENGAQVPITVLSRIANTQSISIIVDKNPFPLSRDRKSTRLNSSHVSESRMPSSA